MNLVLELDKFVENEAGGNLYIRIAEKEWKSLSKCG